MKKPTKLIRNHAGTGKRRTVNPPIERASTVLLPDRVQLYGARPVYGRMGLSVQRELEAAFCDLEHAEFARLAPSGLAACAIAIAALVQAGDNVLFSDSAYGPTRRFCEQRLSRMGVSCERFDPRNTDDLAAKINDHTTLIVMESPGSLTFEISDTRRIVEIAKSRGVRTVMDNTWSAGVFCQPLDLGVDVSIQALTKYVVGHADAFGGCIATSDHALADELENLTEDWGLGLGPDDAYLALRGTRTLFARMKQHETAALKLAQWLESQAGVEQVMHPALESHPDHAMWKRDFSGSSGLFGFVLNASSLKEVDAFMSGLEIFQLGFSWGGFESLLIPCGDQLNRTETDWAKSPSGHLMRLHAGLEDVDDLMTDLEHAFAAMHDVKNT